VGSTCCYYVAELLLSLTDDYDPHPELFDLADRVLQELSGTRLAVQSVVLRFELLALKELGHLPSLTRCVECGTGVEAGGRVAFGQLAGGVLCSRCRAGKRQVVSLSSAAISGMAAFADLSEEAWKTVVLPAGVRGEIRGVINHYISNLLGHRPRMHPYLGFLAQEIR
jgi:DNA repair protein RecO (recombination protein O)